MQRWARARAVDLAALAAAALPGEDLSEDELLAVCWDDLNRDPPDDRPGDPSDGAPPGGTSDDPSEETSDGAPPGGTSDDPSEETSDGAPPEGTSDDPSEETSDGGAGARPRAAPVPGPIGAGAVLATDDGAGAVSVVVRPAPDGGSPTAFVLLVVVHPEAQRAGRGHQLLEAAEAFAWDHGAAELRLEGGPPFYLWPGVDAGATAMHALARSRGYDERGTAINMALPSHFRAPTPNAIDIRRVIEEPDREAVRALVRRVWPEWWAETARAIEHGCCHGAFAAGDDQDLWSPEVAVGFACHSVSRAGWLGPMGTDPQRRTGGIGSALVGQVCRDLMIAEYSTTEICWAGPQDFYAKTGATVSRTFVRYARRRP